MEPEVTAAWISAVGALGGVALGTITGVLAARIQARPAHRAAEAAYAQAESAYRAALDSAREQIRAAAAQNTGSARRQVYAAFINEAHKLQLAIAEFDRDFYQSTVDTREARAALDRVDKAAALVLLEGPEDVNEAAWEVYNEAQAGLSDYESSGNTRAAWSKVIQAGHEQDLLTALDRIRHFVRDRVSPLWRETGKNWAQETVHDLETPFPQVPTHTNLGGTVVPFSQTRETGVFGGARLIEPSDGGAPVPFYETVAPPPELIARLRAAIEGYMFVAYPLIESGTVTDDQVYGILRYALDAEHASSPEREFSHTAGDVANDLLLFVGKAQEALNPQQDA
ncbi:hypothetical protein OIE73_20345 [Streptomyces hirsutus]|uniref:Secreted protein n=1 Tax=Streptomyces hirsutus TaxID=35620 RepID=A0ABZ1GRF2_9ACTN|nr:hypothetical protein [Streptomyces hirsutus]WSD07851.1 hypothetical protein OIE73_20345 [Streptomyces hirsutus]